MLPSFSEEKKIVLTLQSLEAKSFVVNLNVVIYMCVFPVGCTCNKLVIALCTCLEN